MQANASRAHPGLKRPESIQCINAGLPITHQPTYALFCTSGIPSILALLRYSVIRKHPLMPVLQLQSLVDDQFRSSKAFSACRASYRLIVSYTNMYNWAKERQGAPLSSLITSIDLQIGVMIASGRRMTTEGCTHCFVCCGSTKLTSQTGLRKDPLRATASTSLASPKIAPQWYKVYLTLPSTKLCPGEIWHTQRGTEDSFNLFLGWKPLGKALRLAYVYLLWTDSEYLRMSAVPCPPRTARQRNVLQLVSKYPHNRRSEPLSWRCLCTFLGSSLLPV